MEISDSWAMKVTGVFPALAGLGVAGPTHATRLTDIA